MNTHNQEFYESQKKNQWWLHLLLAISEIGVLYGIYKQVVIGETFGTQPAPTGILIGVFFFTLFIHFFITQVVRLETKVDKFGIYYRFRPFINSFQFVGKNDLNKCEVVKYNPLLEYGGWGFRLGLFSNKGRAYNIKGNIGLRLEWLNGKKLLIGTQKPQELRQTLNLWIKKKEVE
ncbi:MAG: DUF6141 family protein [Bacteroidota bacterium]